MRYVLEVAYNGKHFCGWQIQNNGRTVQGELQKAFEKAFKKSAVMTASGRTDSGVHAKSQIVHFDAEISIPPERIADALNTQLPKDVAIRKSYIAPLGFDANRSAKRKTYIYRFYIDRQRTPLLDSFAYQVKVKMDEIKLREICSLFVGTHDFKAYCASGSQVVTTIRTIYSCEIVNEYTPFGDVLCLKVCGGGFLYNMVRTMAGTILGYACGTLSYDDVKATLDGDRDKCGKTLPPNALTLDSVEY